MKNFYYLLNDSKKSDFFAGLSDDNEEYLNTLDKEDIYQAILDIYGMTIEEAIHYFLHYELRIFLSVKEDEIGNAIPLKLAIGIYNKGLFSGILVRLNDNGYYSMYYVGENVSIDGKDEPEVAEKLKQYIGEINFNKANILLDDILLYDNELGTYVSTQAEFDEQFTNRREVYVNAGDNKKIYINSTLAESDIDLVDDL